MGKREIGSLQNPHRVKADGFCGLCKTKSTMFQVPRGHLLCLLAGFHVDFIRLSTSFVNTICGEEEWQHDGQGKELMWTNVIELFSPATRGYCPRGLLCLHHVRSSTFPKTQKKSSETKKNSPVVFYSPNIFWWQYFFFKLPTQQGRCSTVVDLQGCLCCSFLTFKHPYYQCSFPPTVLFFNSAKVPDSSCTQYWYLNRRFPLNPSEMKCHTSLPSFY